MKANLLATRFHQTACSPHRGDCQEGSTSPPPPLGCTPSHPSCSYSEHTFPLLAWWYLPRQPEDKVFDFEPLHRARDLGELGSVEGEAHSLAILPGLSLPVPTVHYMVWPNSICEAWPRQNSHHL